MFPLLGDCASFRTGFLGGGMPPYFQARISLAIRHLAVIDSGASPEYVVPVILWNQVGRSFYFLSNISLPHQGEGGRNSPPKRDCIPIQGDLGSEFEARGY